MSKYYTIISQTCFDAAKAIARDFYELEHLQSSAKSLQNFMLNVDRKSEKIIINKLQKFDSKYHFFVEETQYHEPLVQTDIRDLQYCWIVDPIDGTSNFLHGNPNYSISIALVTFYYSPEIVESGVIPDIKSTSDFKNAICNYTVICGGIYIPYYEEMYYGEKGAGSYKIDRYNARTKLRVLMKKNLMKGLSATVLPSDLSHKYNNLFQMLRENGIKIRISGSISMDAAFVVSNRYDMLFLQDVYLWDIAAATILFREAGVNLRDIDGKHLLQDIDMINNGIIATNSIINGINS